MHIPLQLRRHLDVLVRLREGHQAGANIISVCSGDSVRETLTCCIHAITSLASPPSFSSLPPLTPSSPSLTYLMARLEPARSEYRRSKDRSWGTPRMLICTAGVLRRWAGEVSAACG